MERVRRRECPETKSELERKVTDRNSAQGPNSEGYQVTNKPKWFVAVAICLHASVFMLSDSVAFADGKPNVLFIAADDMNCDLGA